MRRRQRQLTIDILEKRLMLTGRPTSAVSEPSGLVMNAAFGESAIPNAETYVTCDVHETTDASESRAKPGRQGGHMTVLEDYR